MPPLACWNILMLWVLDWKVPSPGMSIPTCVTPRNCKKPFWMALPLVKPGKLPAKVYTTGVKRTAMISASASRALILLASKNGQCHNRKRRSIAHAYFRKRRIPCSLIAFAFRGKTPLWATPICAILVAFTGRVDLLPTYSETQHRGMPAGRIFLYVCSVWNLSGGLPLCCRDRLRWSPHQAGPGL